MRQKTNENKPTSCVYQELNPEMNAFLAVYLEDGRRRDLRESTIHLHDKIGHYFLSAVAETGCLRPQEMNSQSIGGACLRISSKWYLSHIWTFLRYAYHSGYTDRDYSGVVPLFKRPQPYLSVYTAEEILKNLPESLYISNPANTILLDSCPLSRKFPGCQYSLNLVQCFSQLRGFLVSYPLSNPTFPITIIIVVSLQTGLYSYGCSAKYFKNSSVFDQYKIPQFSKFHSSI